MFQSHPHEISGRPVVDANKYALQVLDRTACKHLGIQNQDRPLIGVRGQRKDMGRGGSGWERRREGECWRVMRGENFGAWKEGGVEAPMDGMVRRCWVGLGCEMPLTKRFLSHVLICMSDDGFN